MKYLKYIISGTLICLLITVMFIPIIQINNNVFSPFLLVFSNNFNVYYLILFLSILLGIASSVLLMFEEKHKNFVYASLICSLISALVLLFMQDIISGALSEQDVLEINQINIVIGVLILLYSFYSLTFVFKYNQFSIKDIVESAMLIGLAIVLDVSFLKIRVTGNGGSISFVMVPLIILALRQGFVKGFISCGIVFGFTTCLLDGYGFFTFPFDYLLGFGSLAIVGLFNNIILPKDNKKITIKGIAFLVLSIIVACSLRFIFSTISGVIFYETSFIESMAYQATYIPISAAACLVVCLLLYKPLLIINNIFPHHNFE